MPTVKGSGSEGAAPEVTITTLGTLLSRYAKHGETLVSQSYTYIMALEPKSRTWENYNTTLPHLCREGNAPLVLQLHYSYRSRPPRESGLRRNP